MSKAVKTIATIALPIAAVALPVLAPVTMASIGTAVGASAANAALVGSAITGAAMSGAGTAIGGGSVGDSLLSAALGGVGGALGGGGGSAITDAVGLTGTAADVASGALTGAAYGASTGGGEGALMGAIAGGVMGGVNGTSTTSGTSELSNAPYTAVSESGLPYTTTEALQSAPSGAVATGGGAVSSIAPSTTSSALSSVTPYAGMALSLGNQIMASQQASAAKEAAGIQSESIDKAIAVQQPYTTAGANALAQIEAIQANPTGYIQGNELYSSLADDAEKRLLANQAAKGKVGSGGTASALQDQLLQIGNGLVNQQVSQLTNTAQLGQSSASNVSNLAVSQGDAVAAGLMGSANAYSSGYQNQINTLLALQSLNKSSSYNPTQTVNV